MQTPILLLVALALLAASALAAAEPMVLARGGKTELRIVVAPDATEAENYAASELATASSPAAP